MSDVRADVLNTVCPDFFIPTSGWVQRVLELSGAKNVKVENQ
jgi:hypothetical protein